MPVAVIKRKTDREVVDEIISMIENTHWTQGDLVCPVYKIKKVRAPAPAYLARQKKYIYKDEPIRDERGVPIVAKTTFCAAGLIFKVAGLHDEVDQSGEVHDVEGLSQSWILGFRLWDEDTFLESRRKPQNTAQAKRIIRLLGSYLMDKHRSSALVMDPFDDSKKDRLSVSEYLYAVERWNDHDKTTKQDVLDAFKAIRDKA